MVLFYGKGRGDLAIVLLHVHMRYVQEHHPGLIGFQRSYIQGLPGERN